MKEDEIEKFMEEVLTFLKKNDCVEIDRIVDGKMVRINYKDIRGLL